MAEITTPLTFRADEETKARFAEICEQFANKGAALQALLNAYDMESAKRTLTGSADLIEDFRAHLDALSRAYIAQLDLNANADQRIRAEVSEELSGLAKALHDTQEKAEKAKQETKKAADELAAIKASSQQELAAAAAQVSDTEKRLAAAADAQRAAEETARAKEQTATVLAEQLNDVRAQMAALRHDADKSKVLQTELDAAKKQIQELTAQIKAKDADALLAQKQAALELEQAVIAAERKASEKQETLRDKIDALRDERDTLREKLHTVSAEYSELRRQMQLPDD